MGLAIDGLVSFSSYPLRLLSYFGFSTAILAVILMAWVLIDALTNRTAPRGWASGIVTILFMGSVQMIGLGIIGEYLRLIFLESKGRPFYIVGEYRSGIGSPNHGPTPRAVLDGEAEVGAHQESANP